MHHVKVDHIVPLHAISPLLARVVSTPPPEGGAIVSERMDIEMKIVNEANAIDAGVEQLGPPSPYACPECHGVLLQVEEGKRVRFRCHTGHAYSADSLLAAINEIEDALWNTVRAIDEGARDIRQLAEHVQQQDQPRADRFVVEAARARGQAEAVRQVVTAREALKGRISRGPFSDQRSAIREPSTVTITVTV